MVSDYKYLTYKKYLGGLISIDSIEAFRYFY